MLKRSIKHIIEKLGYRYYRETVFPYSLDVGFDLHRWSVSQNINVVFDVGANIGRTALYYANVFPKAKIYAFEPVSETFDKLAEATSSNTAIRAEKLAFGSKVETLEVVLYPEAAAGVNSVLTPLEWAKEKGWQTETLDISTLDHYCNQQSIQKIDFLKIDVEGFELQVLAGAIDMLQQRRISMIFVEAAFCEGETPHTAFKPLWDYLAGYGFVVSGFYEPVFCKNRQSVLYFANVLFIQIDSLYK